MTLSRDGFPSTHINALADEALRDYCPGHAALVEQINSFAIALLIVPRDIQQRDADLFAVTLLGRAVQDFEGAVLLGARGLRAPSRAMVRSIFETALYCVAASRDMVLSQGAKIKLKKGEAPWTRFVDAFDGGHQRFRGQVASELRDMLQVPTKRKRRSKRCSTRSARQGSTRTLTFTAWQKPGPVRPLYNCLLISLSGRPPVRHLSSAPR
ncbi:hypothetical protein [Caballeronia sp. DA-9]|uniref:hypothetical protein n=1 Tax=Caballeronia sp. DA-9 TaxID=3436237 RepID=UPI003F680850